VPHTADHGTPVGFNGHGGSRTRVPAGLLTRWADSLRAQPHFTTYSLRCQWPHGYALSSSVRGSPLGSNSQEVSQGLGESTPSPAWTYTILKRKCHYDAIKREQEADITAEIVTARGGILQPTNRPRGGGGFRERTASKDHRRKHETSQACNQEG